MPIISKETWDKFTQEEKEKIRKKYQYFNKVAYNGAMASYETLFPEEALQPQPLTYEDVARELLKEGSLRRGFSIACASDKQAEKIFAINKLLNVAKFLNKDWKPDWENMTPDDKVWSLGIDENEIRAYYVQKYDGARAEIVYFRSMALAEKAVAILGEDTVRLALSSDY